MLSYDTRNHGQSAADGVVTFGLHEADDVLGAVDYLTGRDDVDPHRLAAVGFSAGGNSVLYSLPRSGRLRAAVVVQPTSAVQFANRIAADVLGPFGRPVLRLTELFYSLHANGLRLAAIEPLFAAAGAGDTPVLYIQGEGDRWGSVGNVAHMAEVTPRAAGPILVPSQERYGGYRYAVSHPEMIIDFLDEHLT